MSITHSPHGEPQAARVLVADDDDDIRGLVALKLSAAGHDVVETGDGARAFELASEEYFDALVLDVMMPGMTGIDVVRALRSREPSVNTPVLLLTAKSQDRDLEDGFTAGADDYMTKPFSPRDLQGRVAVLIDQGPC